MTSELAPGFLVAAPSLLDPNFKKSVVLLIDHRAEGSLGFVVNRPASVSFKGVADELGLGAPGHVVPDLPVMVGGPVAPHTGWIVFDPEHTQSTSVEGTISVTEKLKVSASRDLLKTIAGSHAALRTMLVLGYAGWGAGQLEAEIRHGAWIPVDLDEKVIFETEPENRWFAALQVLGINPLQLVNTAIADA